MAGTARGRFVWHELMTTDPKAAAAFYKDVVGWTAQTWEQDPSYTLLTSGGRPMAGVMRLPEQTKAMGAMPHWLSYIGTPNVDETARQATEFGGKVLRPAADIPDIGRFAILQDPQGAEFAAFTPKPAPAGDMKPGLGDFSWHELVTTDWQSAWNFCQKLFGWEKTESMEMGPGNLYQMFGWKGHTLGGMFNKPPARPGPPFWLPYALVRDGKKVAEISPRLGGKVVNGPMEVPGGDWITQGTDPQGAMFAVHSKKVVAVAPAASRKAAPARKSKPAKRKSVAAKKSKTAKKKARPKPRPKPRKASRRRR